MKQLEYHTIDKTAWGAGPWQTEPDKLQWRDEATGLPCLIKRTPHVGALCGYVGVPHSHPAYGQDYDSVDVDVHGGLTYADRCQEGPAEHSICHLVEPGEDDDTWWLGFDCGHYMDVCPAFDALTGPIGGLPALGQLTDMGAFGGPATSYKDLAYVQQECASLAAQLAELAVPA